MQQLIYFLQRFKYFLFYLFLVFIALFLTINNLSFHKSKFINSANTITGGLYSKTSSISEYFGLKQQNQILINENTRLRNTLFAITNQKSLDSLNVDISNDKYTFTNAKITKNSYTKPYNYLTINKGVSDGLSKEMAVINSKGIIGITENLTSNYTRIQSILNRNTKINARLKNSNYFGSLGWNGENYHKVQLADIPRQAPLQLGDTIETGGMSAIFPEGIPIGFISDINNRNSANNTVEVTLFNDMSNLNYVYVIKNWEKEEIETLEIIENE